MTQRSRILLTLLAAAALGAPVVNYIYPNWIKPLTTLDESLEQKGQALADLRELEKQVKDDGEEYKAMLGRIGAFDIDRVSVNARDKLNALIEKHGLEAENVTPSRPHEEKKTGVWSTTINVRAVAPLESVIAFLKDVSELPYVLRVGNVSLYPASAGRERVTSRMNLRVPIELHALPPHAKMIGKVDEKDLPTAASQVRHQGRNYALIWSGTPFSDKLPPPPLKAMADRTAGIKQGQEFSLRGSATGGDGNYTFAWAGPGVLEPSNSVSKLDTASLAVGEHEYTLSVNDGAGQSTTTAVKLNVKAPLAAPKTVDKGPPPLPPPPPDPRWADRGQKQLVMMIGGTDPSNDELLVHDRPSNRASYYKAGDDFNGGKLVFVHQTGALVHRKDEFFVHPIGATLDKEIPATSAEMFPELKRVAESQRTEPASVNPAPEAGVGEALEFVPGGGTVFTSDERSGAAEVVGPEAPGGAERVESQPAPAEADPGAAPTKTSDDRRARPPRGARRPRAVPK